MLRPGTSLNNFEGEEAMVMAICLSGVAHGTVGTKTVTHSKYFETFFSQNVSTDRGLGHRPVLSELVARLSLGETDTTILSNEGIKLVEFIHAFYTSIKADGCAKLAQSPWSKSLSERVVLSVDIFNK